MWLRAWVQGLGVENLMFGVKGGLRLRGQELEILKLRASVKGLGVQSLKFWC